MDFSEYEEAAASTAVYPGAGEFMGLAYCGLGAAGEAGEIADKIKKLWRDNGELNEEAVVGIHKEVGDELWYLAGVCREIGTTLESAAVANIAKLQDRYERDVIAGSGDER